MAVDHVVNRLLDPRSTCARQTQQQNAENGGGAGKDSSVTRVAVAETVAAIRVVSSPWDPGTYITCIRVFKSSKGQKTKASMTPVQDAAIRKGTLSGCRVPRDEKAQTKLAANAADVKPKVAVTRRRSRAQTDTGVVPPPRRQSSVASPETALIDQISL